ncbi:MAG: flavodoxin [Crocinitomicaceae bacterium]|nr:flavodoxin [Crocinitomicaceae bacterium]|tara:strand:+ start:2583 stop:3176 length:594 start_codon:yes stop_codon:yes gene_type:complete
MGGLGILLYQPTNDSHSNEQRQKENKTLILYLTRTKNTKAVAEIIQQKVGGNLVELEIQIPYPENYQAHVDQVEKENETGYLPPLKTKLDVGNYDTIFIGFPTWGMQLPPPMKSFLKQYNLSGKTIIPFNTNAKFGVGSGFETIGKLCPDSEVLEGLSTRGGYEKKGVFLAVKNERAEEVKQEVNVWLERIGVTVEK